jgi:oxygen-independent coproporphyrinogen-3 oxidase
MLGLSTKYFEALLREIALYREELQGYTIDTIFIGGGTPSVVDSRFIAETLDYCRKCFDISETCEITIESNPGTITAEKLDAYKNSGINRISIGLQAYQQHLLTFLGRRHSPQDFVNCIKLAQDAGFHNINADIIFGIPGQTMENWKESLNAVIGLDVTHISAYSLKIEEGTKFGTMLENGELSPVDDELDREMYHYTCDFLKQNGFIHYELSNFAKPGYECRHNLIYWKCIDYLGVGAGAHSYINSYRFSNKYSVDKYIESLFGLQKQVEDKIYVDNDDKMSEFMFLGLRLIQGVCNSDFQRIFHQDMFLRYNNSFKMLASKGLLEISEDSVRLTKLGLDLANQVFMEFV